ncbi:hypothetical protein [Glycomyces sp. MUSA5-2]|uniref:hypothetical protein n=1 Tax=Glycomyces sp. MUSA5-2 TaxID=2053002 RepID=UPI003008B80D
MNTAVLLLGAGTGTGLAMIASALWPTRPTLAGAVSAYRADTAGASAPRAGRSGSEQEAGDIACLGLDPAAVHQRRTRTQTWLVAAGLGLALLLAARGSTAWPLVLLAAGGCALAVPRLAAMRLHRKAEAARADFRYVTGTIADVVTVDLAGGAGVEGALEAATAAGEGREFAALRAVLNRAHLSGQPVWEALRAFGSRIRVPALFDLGGVIGLSATEGAQVRETLTRRVESARASDLADVEAAKAAATEQMTVPIVLIVAAIVLRLIVPSIVAVQNTI